MNDPILIGDRGHTIGPLKPGGRISVNGRTIDASSEGSWIDADAEVVVIGGNTRRAIVRAAANEAVTLANRGDRLPDEQPPETTPLQAPPSVVEQVNAIAIGVVIGVVLIPIAWLAGAPLSFFALLAPVAGAVAGWMFRKIVGVAFHFAGPREDHRPMARAIAGFVLLGCLVGAAVGLNFGFLGLSCGLAAGALVAGMLICIGVAFSHLV